MKILGILDGFRLPMILLTGVGMLLPAAGCTTFDVDGVRSDAQILSELATYQIVVTSGPFPDSNSISSLLMMGTVSSLEIKRMDFFSDPLCSAMLETGSRRDFVKVGISVAVPKNLATSVYLQGVDAAGFRTPCYHVTDFTHDDKPPVVAVSAPSSSHIVNGGSASFTIEISDATIGLQSAGVTLDHITLEKTDTADCSTVALTGSDVSYTLSLSGCSGDGTIAVTVAEGVATDKLGNVSILSRSLSVLTVDAGAPVISEIVARPDGRTIHVTFSEVMLESSGVLTGANYTVSGVGLGTLSAQPDTVTYVSGLTYALNWNSGEMLDGAPISVIAANLTDLAGNALDNSSPPTGNANALGPEVVSVSVVDTQNVRITFNETMGANVTSASLYVVSGSGKGTLADNPTSVALVTGNTYQLTWSSGEMLNGGDLSITAWGLQDAAGNTIGPMNRATHSGGAVGTPPTVSIGAPNRSVVGSSNSTSFTVTYTGADSVSLSAANIILNGSGPSCSVGVTNGNPASTVILSSCTGNGALGISIAAATASDLAGNLAASAGPSTTFTVDTLAPTISSFVPAAGTRAFMPSTVSVTFNENMESSTVTNIGNWSVTCSSSGNYTVSNVSLSGNIATVTLGTTTAASGGSVCSLAASGSILDLAENGLSGGTSVAYTIAPAVIGVSDGMNGDFGDAIENSTLEAVFTLSNSGGVTATGIAAGTPVLGAPYSFKGGSYPGTGGTCGSSLLASATCTLYVTFNPTVTGTFNDSIRIDYQDGVSAQTVVHPITGTGTTAAALDLGAGAYGFGARPLNTTTASTFTLSNSGGWAASTIDVLTLSAPFSVTASTCGSTLLAGSSCQIEVSFQPIANGTFNGTLQVNYQDGSGAQSATRSVSGSVQLIPVPSHFYDFEDISGAVLRDSVGGLNGVLTGSPAQVSGKFGSSLEFTGSELGEVSGFPSVGGAFSASWWMLSSQGMVDSTLFQLSTVGDLLKNLIGLSSSGDQLGIYPSDTSSGSLFRGLISRANVNDGTWHHVVVTQSASTNATIKGYLDGTLVTTLTSVSGISESAGSTLRLGARIDGQNPFVGKLDQLRIYIGSELTQSEINALAAE